MSARSRSLFSLLPGIFLLLLPALAFNIGARHIFDRQQHNQNARRQLEAETILDSFSENWDFPSQMAWAGARFRESLQENFSASRSARARAGLLKTAARKHFSAPFPQHQLWVLSLDPANQDSLPDIILQPNTGTISRRPFSLAVRHLVKGATGATVSAHEGKVGDKMTRALFGENSHPYLLFSTQIGRVTPIFHQQKQHYLFWDLIKNNDGKPVAAFFLLTLNAPPADEAGMKLAVRNCESSYPRGFVRFHASGHGDILLGSRRGQATIRRWRRQVLSRFDIPSLERQPSGILSNPLNVGDLFVKIIPECSHLGVVLLPKAAPSPNREFLNLVTLIFSLIVLLIFFRGTYFGQWPRLRLHERFILLYALCAAFPFIAVAVVSILYVREKQDSLLLDLQRKLQTELISIDLGKDRFQTKMMEGFHKTFHHPEFQAIVSQSGVSDSRLLDIGTKVFSELGAGFPQPFIGIYDFRGNTLARDGTFVYERSSDMASFFRCVIIASLWRALDGKIPPDQIPPNPLKPEEQMLLDVFEGAAASKVENMFGEYRNLIAHLTMGRESLSKIHDCITVDGIDRYALMILWRNEDFAVIVLRESLERFLQAFPHGIFMSYQRDRGGFRTLLTESRIHKHLRDALETRGGLTGTHIRHDPDHQRLTIISVSRRNREEILAASVDTSGIAHELDGISLQLAGAFFWWLFTTAGLLWFTVGRIVTPIRSMTHALQGVSDGNLNQKFSLDRPDELGRLSDAFEQMISGLKRGKRLSTVVSQKAREDLFTGNAGHRAGERPYRTHATTLVSDIRGFTTICESRPVTEVTSLLNCHFDIMTTVIAAHQGRVDKFIGDAIQAIFEEQADPASEPSAQRALKAAFTMLQRLEEMNRDRVSLGLFPYSVGIGLAHGEVLIGGFGDRVLRFDYSVMGEPMHQAAALEDLSKKVPYFPLVVSPEIRKKTEGKYPELHPLPGFETIAFVFPPGIGTIPS
jgi:class 3 adenylate cyclase